MSDIDRRTDVIEPDRQGASEKYTSMVAAYVCIHVLGYHSFIICMKDACIYRAFTKMCTYMNEQCST